MDRKQNTSTKLRTSRAAQRWSMAALLLIPAGAWAQGAVHASGGSGTISGNTYAYSIGEMAVVGTGAAGNFTYTQGVLQGNADTGAGVPDEGPLQQGLSLYPNPAADVLYLQPALQAGSDLILRLYDASGKLLLDRNIRLGSGDERQQIRMAEMAEGAYFLNAVLRNGGQQFQRTFKVLKTATGR